MQNVTVLGTGVLGRQIMYQAAFHGKKVMGYDISDEIIEQSRKQMQTVANWVAADIPEMTPEKTAEALANIRYTSDLATAVADADIVIEAVPEAMEIKKETYSKMAPLLPEKTILCTNSSTLLPSMLMDCTGRPEKFMALHYANHVWKMNTAECMPSPKTAPETFEAVVRYAEETGMVPIRIMKEKDGYILNSLLIPLLNAACKLYGGGFAEPADIDATWRIGTGAPHGPFAILDIVGPTTAFNIMSASPDPELRLFAKKMKEEYMDKGKLGLATGEGFFKYN